MLKEMSVSNYKSINTELVFSMEADIERVSELPEHVIHMGDTSLLKVTSMYGPNGGGKSNILAALLLAKGLFLNRENPIMIPEQLSCIFQENQIVEETLFFVTKEYEIGYQFKMIPQLEEKNMVNPFNGLPQKVYYVIYQIIEEHVSYRKLHQTDYLSLLSRNETGEIKSNILKECGISDELILPSNQSAIQYINSTFTNHPVNKQEPFDVIQNLALELLSIQDLNVHNMTIDEKVIKIIQQNQKKLVHLLNDADIRIKDLKLYQERQYPIFFVREIKNKNKKIEKEMSLLEESSGTQKIFWMFVKVLHSITDRNIFVCDDMNALLHPKLFRSMIELFTSKENQTSQLIFNSHDILNMDSTLFRRDEIWFVYRDETYSTQAVPLSNIVNYKGEQVRKDAKYSKQYLEGKYGADPFIKKGFFWNE